LGFNSWQGQDILLFSKMSRTGLGPSQPPIQLVPGVLSQAVKQLGHNVPHPHLTPKSRKRGVVTLFPLEAFMVWTGKIFFSPF